MATALSALANASAVLQVPSSGTVTDPNTGNVSAAAASVTVSLFLKAESIETRQFPGVDSVEILYNGYALEALDSRVVVGTQGTLTFAGETTMDCEVTGVRLPFGKTGLLGATLNAALGEKIQLVSRSQG